MPRLRRMLQNHKKALAVGMQLDGSDAVAPPIPFETIMASLGALTASGKAAVATRLSLPRPNYFLTPTSDEGNGVRSALRPRLRRGDAPPLWTPRVSPQSSVTAAVPAVLSVSPEHGPARGCAER